MARSNFAFPVPAVATSVGAFMPRLLSYLLLLAGCLVGARAQLASVDAGATAAGFGPQIKDQAYPQGESLTWVRLWNAPGAPHLRQIHKFDPEAQAMETSALSELRYRDIRPILFLRWSERSWTAGIRPGGGQRVPLDLREMYRRGINYGQAYGATGAAFEIENEPDISFVQDNPETYMAFLKAAYLGIKHGASTARAEDGAQRAEGEAFQAGHDQMPRAKSQAGHSDFTADAFFKLGRPGDRWLSSGRQRDLELTANRSSLPAQQTAPLVVMAPLALPPGPYFEQLVANGLFSYTDAFNYHYYGYAEDFTGVYRQFENAVAELGKPETRNLKSEGSEIGGLRSEDRGRKSDISLSPTDVRPQTHSETQVSGFIPQVSNENHRPQGSGLKFQPSSVRSLRKTLPVLLTEFGYGSLAGAEADTVDGRVRQWRWFKTVGEQILDLRIAGPMAFYLPPYLENKALEFGLTMRSADSRLKLKTGNLKPEVGSLKPGEEKPDPETGNLKPERSENGGLRSEDRGRKSDISLSPTEVRPQTYSETQVSGLSTQVSNRTFQASHLTFTPADFGLKKSESWMYRIGQKFGENEATPALAWLQETGNRKPYRPKNWTIHAPEPSPVVIDFIAGDGLIQQKRYGGYVAMRERAGSLEPGATSLAEGEMHDRNTHVSGLKSQVFDRKLPVVKSGSGEIVLYNFSDVPLTGRLEIVHGRGLLAEAAVIEREWTLEPMARQVVPVTLTVPADRFVRHELALRFMHEGQRTKDGGQRSEDRGGKSEDSGRKSALRSPSSDVRSLLSLFSTFFYPEASEMKEIMLFDFNSDSRGQRAEVGGRRAEGGSQISVHAHEITTRRNQALLAARRLATEEPRLRPAARWNVTQGMKVEEMPDHTWRFHITDFPSEPNKPAMAELPLPDDFSFPDRGMLCFTYRLTQPANTTVANGKYFEPYFRTANGNLYQVWPRQYAMGTWNGHTEVKENFTMAFYNRSNLPWRFRDNRPVALVFVFRPGRASLPATYEVRDMRIVELVAEQGGDPKPES